MEIVVDVFRITLETTEVVTPISRAMDEKVILSVAVAMRTVFL